MDKVSLTALARQHLAAAHDADWDGRRVITSSSPPPGTACTPMKTASPFSPSPNLFSGKANSPMTTNCLGSEANVHRAHLFQGRTPGTAAGGRPFLRPPAASACDATTPRPVNARSRSRLADTGFR
jgi:hypothetical protein